MMSARAEKNARIRRVNEFIECIARVGRRGFFNYEGVTHRTGYVGHVSRFERDHHGRVCFRNGYGGARCYRRPVKGLGLGWFGNTFIEGGTLNVLCQQLDDYIRTGEPQPLSLGPWPEYICNGDLWGYGDSMGSVRAKAGELGITPPDTEGSTR